MAQILLAADGVVSMRLGAALFQEASLEVTAVTDGRSALERLTQAPNFYDLIVLDYELPEIDCVACLRFIGKMLRRMPTLVLSEDLGEIRLRELGDVGVPARHVLPRTVSPEDFVEEVKKALSDAQKG